MSKDSFASLMATGSASVSDRARKRLDRGQVLDVTVIQVSSEFVYVDVGTPGDGKIPVAELTDENGKLRVKVGDTVRASVIEAHMTGSLLRALQSAHGKDVPKPDEVLDGKVTRVENYGVFALVIVQWFSRRREFRADEGGASLSERDNMVSALRRLARSDESHLPDAVAAFGITPRSSRFGALFSSHPPIEERIARLQQAPA